MNDQKSASQLPVFQRMCNAINAHDIDAFVSCFTADYISEQPLHPDRGILSGSERVRTNWTSFFAQVPDLHAELLATTSTGEIAWAEWHWHGTRTDGSKLNMRGVTVAGLRNEIIAWARLYVEPVQEQIA